VVARVFQRALGLGFLLAFASLGVQVNVLIGSEGLLPLSALVERLAERPEVGWLQFPTVFWLSTGDLALNAGIWVGLALSALAVLGRWPRACFAALVVLYLSYTTACRDLLYFQWDNLLLECGLLATLLPRDRALPWLSVLFRIVLFKLYFESGVAKWQSPLGDWFDGSAMTFYYETAPIPTALAWYMHHLPDAWHHLESRATLLLELVIPWGVFGSRRIRLATLAALTGFQLLNLATANYGFFICLVLALHLFLLDDDDLTRAWTALTHRLRFLARRSPPATVPQPPRRRWRTVATATFIAAFATISTIEFAWAFADSERLRAWTAPVRSAYAPFRLVHAYHLFGHVTRERVEPEFQSRGQGDWKALDLHYKAGPVDRAPPWIAPHQPRIDFRLWFYGLSFRREMPDYVGTLLYRICVDPQAVQPLFATPLDPAPDAVRIVFARYRFSEPGSDAWWTRSWVGALPELGCPELRKRAGP